MSDVRRRDTQRKQQLEIGPSHPTERNQGRYLTTLIVAFRRNVVKQSQ